MAAQLAEALYRLDRKADAEHFADLSLELASTDDIASQVGGRAVKAKLLAAKGDYEAADHLAREAVGLSDDTDDLVMRAKSFCRSPKSCSWVVVMPTPYLSYSKRPK